MRLLALALVVSLGISSVGEIPQENPEKFVVMYSGWPYSPDVATIRPAGYKERRKPRPAVVRRQARDIIRHVGDDAILLLQYDPAQKNQVKSLKRNFWPLFEEFPSLRVCVLLETVFSKGYVGDEVGGDMSTRTSIDIDDPRNEDTLYHHVDFVYNRVVKPYEENYHKEAGRFCLAMWNNTIFEGDLGRVMKIVKQKYPVFLYGGELAHVRPSTEEHRRRVSEYDGIYFYMPYDGGISPNYAVNSEAYLRGLRLWRIILDEGRGELLDLLGPQKIIAGYAPAFDDHLLRGQTNPVRLPERRDENELLLHRLKNLWCEGIVDGTSFINDEPYEGAGNVRNTKHVRPWLRVLRAWKLVKNHYVRHECPTP